MFGQLGRRSKSEARSQKEQPLGKSGWRDGGTQQQKSVEGAANNGVHTKRSQQWADWPCPLPSPNSCRGRKRAFALPPVASAQTRPVCAGSSHDAFSILVTFLSLATKHQAEPRDGAMQCRKAIATLHGITRSVDEESSAFGFSISRHLTECFIRLCTTRYMPRTVRASAKHLLQTLHYFQFCHSVSKRHLHKLSRLARSGPSPASSWRYFGHLHRFAPCNRRNNAASRQSFPRL